MKHLLCHLIVVVCFFPLLASCDQEDLSLGGTIDGNYLWHSSISFQGKILPPVVPGNETQSQKLERLTVQVSKTGDEFADVKVPLAVSVGDSLLNFIQIRKYQLEEQASDRIVCTMGDGSQAALTLFDRINGVYRTIPVTFTVNNVYIREESELSFTVVFSFEERGDVAIQATGQKYK